MMLQKEAKLLAYVSLCRPIPEYAYVVWDPLARNEIYDIELVQNSTLRFISNLIRYLRQKISYRSRLKDGRKNHRLCFRTIYSLRQNCKRQTPGDSYHLSSCQRSANLNILQEKRLPHKFSATNYVWRKQLITTIKHQKAVTIANPHPEIVKTRGFPIYIGCC